MSNPLQPVVAELAERIEQLQAEVKALEQKLFFIHRITLPEGTENERTD
jgi:hypothetical protein